MLQLNDFTGQSTAPVGLCDAFYEPKAYVKPAEFHQFNAPTVLLARMPCRVWTGDETFAADIEVFHYGPQELLRLTNLVATIRDSDGKVLAKHPLPTGDFTRTNCQPAGKVIISLKDFPAPAKYIFDVSADDGALHNDWEFWVFPKATEPDPSNTVHIANSLDSETLSLLKQGGKVLLLPKLETIRGGLPMAFTTMFWTHFGRKGGQSSGNGILVDPEHPAFASFPTEFHSNWHWWELLTRCRPMILDEADDPQPWPKPCRPLVQLIDGWKTNRKLALLAEARIGSGRLAICSMDIESDLEGRPVARQFRQSLLSYLNSPAFVPRDEVTPEMVLALLDQPRRKAEANQ